MLFIQGLSASGRARRASRRHWWRTHSVNWGNCTPGRADYKKAEDELRHALGVIKLNSQSKAQEAAIATALADCLREQGRHADGRILYQSAVDLLQTTTGTNNAKVAEALRNLAQSYLDTGDYVQAESLLVKAPGRRREQAYGAPAPGFGRGFANSGSRLP